jgi:hypothetical protein
MTQGPDDAVLRIALEVLRRNFGMDVSPAASLTGDALLEWVQAADKVLCEQWHTAPGSTSGPHLEMAFKLIETDDKKA